MRLSAVLDQSDFSIAELCAQRLDGDLFSVGDGYTPSDIADDVETRAASLAITLGPERVAARTTAAWIWKAFPRLERPLQVCVGSGRSQAIEPLRGVVLRESTLTEDDIVSCCGLRITSPRRTALDLVRDPRYRPEDAAAVAELMRLAGDSGGDLVTLLNESRFRRESVRARERLESLAA